MEKSHESGVATHIGPESCGAAREGGVEALTKCLKLGKRSHWHEIRFRAAPSVNVEDGGAGGRPVNVA